MSNYSINPDERDGCDFGVLVKGAFDHHGMPTGWTLAPEVLASDLPRWLTRESVLGLSEDHVYVRGMYSVQLSWERDQAKRRGAA